MVTGGSRVNFFPTIPKLSHFANQIWKLWLPDNPLSIRTWFQPQPLHYPAHLLEFVVTGTTDQFSGLLTCPLLFSPQKPGPLHSDPRREPQKFLSPVLAVKIITARLTAELPQRPHRWLSPSTHTHTLTYSQTHEYLEAENSERNPSRTQKKVG